MKFHRVNRRKGTSPYAIGISNDKKGWNLILRIPQFFWYKGVYKAALPTEFLRYTIEAPYYSTKVMLLGFGFELYTFPSQSDRGF